LGVVAKRLLELGGEVGVVGEQRLAAQRAGERPWLPLRVSGRVELRGDAFRVVAATESGVEIDELCSG